MTYHIGEIIDDTEYTPASEWCFENNATLTEVDPFGDVRRFRIDEIPPYVPSYDDIKQMRIQYRQEHIDNQTLERQRKQANGTWTEEDEQTYLALDAEVTSYIEEHYPYPVGGA